MPAFIPKLSIKTKLTAIILAAVLPSVLLFSVYIIYLASSSLREAAVDEARVLVKAHNQDFIRILLVNTPDLGADTVSRLSKFKQLKDIVLYNEQDEITFVYQAEDTKLPTSKQTQEILFTKNELHIVQPVTNYNKRYGDVYFRVSLNNLTTVLYEFYRASIFAVPFLLLFSLLMALIFQRSFSRPVIHLANVIEGIASSKDYSMRVPEIYSKEMGTLYRGFNEMLDIIQNNISTISKNKARLSRAQKMAHLGYWEYCPENHKILLSDGMCKILHLSNNTTSPKVIFDLIDQKNKIKALRRIALVYTTSQPYSMQLKFRLDEDLVLYAQVTVEKHFDAIHKKHYLFGIVQDITEQYLNEERIRQVLLEKQKADSANHAKSAFLANMSHELRTPLNAIIGYSEIIMEDAVRTKKNDLVEDSERIHSAGNYLLSLIENVLDLSKIEADKMEIHYESISIRDTINEIVDTMHPLLAKNGNQFTVKLDDALDVIETDLTKLRQILFNLIGNANKFTANGDITLDIWQSNIKGSDWCYISIIDSGIGIKPSQITKLFKPFAQADRTITRDYGGTGLGLVISKRFCELLGGGIDVESEPNIGSIFTIRLPLRSISNLSSDYRNQAFG